MNMSNIEQKIFDFFDNELSAEEIKKLFEELSRNEKARDLFKDAAILKNTVSQTKQNFPLRVDEILRDVTIREDSFDYSKSKKTVKTQLQKTIMYTFAAAIILFGIFTYSLLNKYEKQIDELKEIMRLQNKTISLIMNGLPDIKVSEKYSNEIVIQNNL